MTGRFVAFLARTDVWVAGLALVAFLVLYWALRGAPIGQAAEEGDEDAPGAGYRDRVVAAVVAGLLLVVAGAYVALARSLPWSLPLFALGFGLVLTLIRVNRRHRHGSPTLRRTIAFADTVLTTTLLLGVLIVANVLAFKYGGPALDFTRERSFTLSSLTLNQLGSLSRPVTFTSFFGEGPRALRQADRVGRLLDLYKAANPSRIRLERVSYRDREEIESLIKRVPDLALTGGGVLIEYGEAKTADRVVVRNSDLFEGPRPGTPADPSASSFLGEDVITSALIRLREAKKSRVAFTSGHGEPSPGELDPRRPGLGLWKSRLTSTGSETFELNLRHEEIVPETALVIVDSPKTPFQAEEVAKLREYADRGGRLLVIAGHSEKSGLEDFLKSFNVEVGPGLIVDPRLNYNRRVQIVLAPIVGSTRHPIVDSLANRTVLLPFAAPIRIRNASATDPPANPGVLATPILRTSDGSWVETDLNAPRVERGENEERGPLIVGVAVADRSRPGAPAEEGPRLVLLSSRYVADNQSLELEPTNLDLLMNAVNWLRGRPELRGIAPKTHVALALSADPSTRLRLVLVPTLMAILVIIGLGVTTYMARRE